MLSKLKSKDHIKLTLVDQHVFIIYAIFKVLKSLAHIRFTEFLQCSELIRITVPQARDTGRLLQFSGDCALPHKNDYFGLIANVSSML